MRRLIAAAVLLLCLGGCSSGLSQHRQADGSCIQTRSNRFLGIRYSTSDYRVNCASS
jgi:hypothetical protein